MTITLPSLSAGSAAAAYSAAVVNAAINQQKTNSENIVNGIQGFDALLWNNSTATLASDTLSLTSKPRVLVIDTEGAASTDNLSTISNGTAYQILWIKAANAGRVITVKHNVGNIKLNSGLDLVLNTTNWLMLFYDGTQWSDNATYAPSPAMQINTARSSVGSPVSSVVINSIPATYKHLMLILELRTDLAATLDSIIMRFNADATAGNYFTQYSSNFNTTFASSEYLGATKTGVFLGSTAAGSTAPANSNGLAVIYIANYASVSLQRFLSYQGGVRSAGTSGTMRSAAGCGWWTNTAAAISSITFLPDGGTNIAANSAYTLYGLN